MSNKNDLGMLIASQTAELLRVRHSLEKVCSKEELQFLLVINDCGVIEGTKDMETLLDWCADILTFGSLYKCQRCQKGDMLFSKHDRTCNAWINEWVKCRHFEVASGTFTHEVHTESEPKAVNRAVCPNTSKDSPKPSTSAGTSIMFKNQRQVRVGKFN
jgi:PADR1 (NUC008) domain